jgi:hypothetical protein
MNIHQWRKHINNFNNHFEENTEVINQWNKNTIINLPRFTKQNSIWNLRDLYAKGNQKAFVLVGASPCLKKDVEKLKNLDDNFRIICANSSLRFLLSNGIKPHYVICLDSDEIDIPQHLDCDSKDITLLASSVVCDKVLSTWEGPIWYMPYYSIDKGLRPKIRRKLGRPLPGGGNSITQALMVATILFGAKIVVFVANEYCFDDSYYADKDAAKQEVLETLYPTKDVLGRQRWTLPSLYMYAIWTEKSCGDLTPPGLFIDTSFGLLGLDSKAINNMDLDDAIVLVKRAYLNKKDNEVIAMVEKKTNDTSKVLRYDLSTQRSKLLQLARS